MGLFYEPLSKGLRSKRLGIAEYARDQPSDSFNRSQGGRLSTGQYIVPKRDLFVHQVFGHSFVHSFISTADEGDMWLARPAIKGLLIKSGATRSEKDSVTITRRLERFSEGLDHQHHSRTSPKRRIVDLPIRALTEATQIDERYLEKTSLLSAPHHTDLQRRFEKLREECDN